MSPDTLIESLASGDPRATFPASRWPRTRSGLCISAGTGQLVGGVAIDSPRTVRKECQVGRCRGHEEISKGWIVMIELRFSRLDASAIA